MVFSYGARCFFLVHIFCSLNLYSEEGYASLEARIQNIFTDNKSAIVRVKASKEKSVDGKKTRLLKMGSGFFVSKNGHILTTGLLPDAERIWIEFNKSYYLAEHLGSDSLCNLTLLKTIEKPRDFSFVSFESLNPKVSRGSFLVGVTCALEFEIGPTFGIMQSYESSFGRNLFPTKMLRSSLPLGPGEVGGPVFDLHGNFIGITYAALPEIQSSFILNARACSRIRDGLLLYGKVDYGWFGITVSKKLNEQNNSYMEIKSASPDSKLKFGDKLIKIGNKQISDRGDIVESTFFAKPGTFVKFLINRDGKEMTIQVKVSKRSISSNIQNQDSNIQNMSNDSNQSVEDNVLKETNNSGSF